MRPILDADYAAIEARITPWIAGQEDALDEYRKVDAAQTKEEKWLLSPYVLMAAFTFQVEPSLRTRMLSGFKSLCKMFC